MSIALTPIMSARRGPAREFFLPPEDAPYGRLYRAEDLEGHRWMFMQRPERRK
jgi:hypothetical protein